MNDFGTRATRRSFFGLTAAVMGLIGAGGIFWALTDTMNPDAETLAKRRDLDEIDLSHIQPGQGKIVAWRRIPLIVYHRNPYQFEQIRAEDWRKLRYPQSDESRVISGHDDWLVVKAVCTFEPCVLITDPYKHSYGQWWECPCCGSRYDGSGRIRVGPGKSNLLVPDYVFLSDNRIRINKI